MRTAGGLGFPVIGAVLPGGLAGAGAAPVDFSMTPADDGVIGAMRPLGVIAGFDELARRLYERSGASRWSVSEAEFSAALARAVARRFADVGAAPSGAEVAAFLDSLHLEDLALALGCRAGVDAAWREFDSRFRSLIERIACSITSDADRAREIAGSLYGDLYGAARGGERRSPLDHYHGRSALGAWLRAVIAQREAQAWRAAYRAHPAAEFDGDAALSGNHAAAEPEDPDRARLLALVATALSRTIKALDSRDRMRLSCYYVQELTLAETGALLGEHESTVSRNLARTRAEIRRAVEDSLRQEYRLSDDQIERCFEYAAGDWPFDLARTLAQASG